MTPAQAVKAVFRNYANFGGRASRSEYWWWAATQVATLLAIAATALTLASGIAALAALAFIAVAFIPNLAVIVRRLHDTGRSGWWLALTLVPYLGSLALLVLLALKSQPDANRWGAPPAGGQGTEPTGRGLASQHGI